MNIIVCLKQVPGTTDVKIDPETNTLKREGIENVVNPFDTYALEEAVLLKEKFSGTVTVVSVGQSDTEDTLRMAAETVKQFGRIDILVNNAAMIYGITRKPFMEIPVAEWDKLMTVNLRGPFLCCRAVFPQMEKQGKGKIINIASEAPFTGSKNYIHYVASKGGIIGFTRALAAEVGQYGIRVNAIAPGFTDTEAARTLTADITKYDVSPTPLGRLEQPDDLVGAVIFLSSDDSDFITGQTLVVDGGRYMH